MVQIIIKKCSWNSQFSPLHKAKILIKATINSQPVSETNLNCWLGYQIREERKIKALGSSDWWARLNHPSIRINYQCNREKYSNDNKLNGGGIGGDRVWDT